MSISPAVCRRGIYDKRYAMYDLVIIGSGPAGLSAAIYASRAGLDYTVIEKEYMGTGRIAYAERVDNFPGHYGIDGFTLGEKFREHAEALGAQFIEGEAVSLEKSGDIWKTVLSDGSVYESKTVIYAAGASAKRLGIPGESEYTGRGVSYCALCDGSFFDGRDVAVVGGGDTALSDALYLSQIAKTVYLIHRRDTFRANDALVKRALAAENIIPVYDTVPVEIIGEDNVTALGIRKGDAEDTLGVSAVFVAIGSDPNTAVLAGVAELDDRGCIKAGEDCITTAPGLFAAGDVRTKKVRQVITAAADGACAAIAANEYMQYR